MSYSWKQTEHDKANGKERYFFTDDAAIAGYSEAAAAVITRCTDLNGRPIPPGEVWEHEDGDEAEKGCYLLEVFQPENSEGRDVATSYSDSLKDLKRYARELLSLDGVRLNGKA